VERYKGLVLYDKKRELAFWVGCPYIRLSLLRERLSRGVNKKNEENENDEMIYSNIPKVLGKSTRRTCGLVCRRDFWVHGYVERIPAYVVVSRLESSFRPFKHSPFPYIRY
jgi:hypothetical protein